MIINVGINLTILNNFTAPVTDFRQIKAKVLSWSKQFNTFCFLDNNQYHIQPHTQECLLAAGIKDSVVATTSGSSLSSLQTFINDHHGKWIFGHLGYDLKNELEGVTSRHPDPIGFGDMFFFEPTVLIRLSEDSISIETSNPREIFEQINSITIENKHSSDPITINHRIPKAEYLSIIRKLQQHILRGDCYEINFCQEFFAENAHIDPFEVYAELAQVSPNPFSALYRVQDRWLICASPERFLQKQDTKIISQPIKGTSKRVVKTEQDDELQKNELYHSQKDRSENVMIVDLVRNDLAKVCKEGSVHVDELYGIYSFPQVHQMISTISGHLRNDVSFTDILRATFPMGSMTGAPKLRVIGLIEQYERTRRGIFSGAIGYIEPGGNFDFNVVIRSILYNATTNYLSYLTGSGITFYSDPEQEWQECQWKAEAMQKVLE